MKFHVFRGHTLFHHLAVDGARALNVDLLRANRSSRIERQREREREKENER